MNFFKLTCALSALAWVVETSIDSSSCGINNPKQGLIVGGGGFKSKRNEWPWLAALIHQPTQSFFCGGTLISQNHVLTAAHCIQNKGVTDPLKSHEVLILLGKYNLSDSSEREAQLRHPSEIIIHPHWNISSEKYDADIAVLHLKIKAELSESVAVICLWSRNLWEDRDENIQGTVVGWGASEHTNYLDHEEVSYHVPVRRVPTVECYLNDYLFAKISSNRTFCAGGQKENSGPCSGDSGGGFYVRVDGLWYIIGIVSGSFLNRDRLCDLRRNTIYTDINSFKPWIEERLENHLQDCKVEQVAHRLIEVPVKTRL